jgi:outer membrane lipopolysaccharide assembly protein LptE/RlpB
MKLVLALCLLIISSCSYSFRGSLPSNLKTIYISPFGEKDTGGRALAANFTNVVNQAFIDDNTLLSVPKNKADLVLTGNIESVSRTTTKVDLANRAAATGYEIKVIVSVECVTVSTKKSLVKTRIDRNAQIDANASNIEIDAKIAQLLDEIKDIVVDRVIGAW